MSKLQIEVVFALPDQQSLQIVLVEPGVTVADVITKSGLQGKFPDHDLGEMIVGVWGRQVAKDRMIKDGDRIELYRPLELEPREARRQLALAGRTMSNPNSD